MFFFSSRRRHTRYWRDWSSACALPIYDRGEGARRRRRRGVQHAQRRLERRLLQGVPQPRPDRAADAGAVGVDRRGGGRRDQIGRACGRGRGEVSGVGGSLKKKQITKEI